PDAQILYVGCAKTGGIAVIDLALGEVVNYIAKVVGKGTRSLVIDKNGSYLVQVCKSKFLRIWWTETMTSVDLACGAGPCFRDARWMPDSKTLLLATDGDAAGVSLVSALQITGGANTSYIMHPHPSKMPTTFTVDSKGQKAWYATIRLFLILIDSENKNRIGGIIKSMQLDPKGTKLAVTFENPTVRLDNFSLGRDQICLFSVKLAPHLILSEIGQVSGPNWDDNISDVGEERPPRYPRLSHPDLNTPTIVTAGPRPMSLGFAGSIIIQGFKSYKDQTSIEPFSKSHNVIVGRNGSGKRYFFWAIRFVLSDAYSNMTREERQALLHEGTGPATISAYVEIIFENSDARFPTGRDEVVLRRTIGLKKDEYSLDRKTVTKTDVMNLLESAGFSRSNPYYIVPQGRIMALTNAKDSERLQVLKEVAGTRVYETRRQESLKIMEETESKRAKITELLDYIEQRLAELEEEKAELKEFQDLDREKRCLEYTIFHREQTEVNSSLEMLEESRKLEVDVSQYKQHAFAAREKAILEVESEIRKIQHELEALKRQRLEGDDDRQEHMKAYAALEMIVKDLEELNIQNSENKKKLMKDLAEVDKLIQAKEAELETILPLYVEAVESERSLKERKQAIDTDRQALLDKQGRSKQYRNQQERDKYLTGEIKSLKSSLSTSTKQSEALTTELNTLNGRLMDVREEINALVEKMDGRKGALEEVTGEVEKLRGERGKLDEKRKELWRDEQRASVALETAKDERSKAERTLMSGMDRNTSSGLQAIKRIAARQNLRGVYGPLYELFDVDERYKTAVEVVGGASLFHVVVDTDETATQLLTALNRDRAGRVTFMPLNRLKPRTDNLPQATNDMIPMISKLQYDPLYHKAFLQVFGKAVICPNLTMAAQYARQDGLTAVTYEGDRADRKGSLTGGYHDTRKSKLEAIKTFKTWDARLVTESETLERVKLEVVGVEQEITKIRDKLMNAEARKDMIVNGKEPLILEKRGKNKEEKEVEDLIGKKEVSLSSIKSSIKILETQLASLEAELKTPLQRTLTEGETTTLDELTEELETVNGKLTDASKSRMKLESRKKILSIELDANLKKRREKIVQRIENGTSSESADPSSQVEQSQTNASSIKKLDSRKAELKTLEKKLAISVAKIQCIFQIVSMLLKYVFVINAPLELDTKIEDLESDLLEENTKLEKIRNEQIEDHKSLEKQQRSLEKYHQKKSLLIKRKEECTRNIRDLGVLPEEALREDIAHNKTSQQLLAKLHKVNEKLKKYSHVNKKAFEQYNNFTKQRDGLNQRKDELDTSAKAIEDLIKVLDQRKDEAIERTFKQVALFFSEVWRKLVPNGRGKLNMLSRAGQNADDMEVDDDAPEVSAIDRYSGIGISVSFSSHISQDDENDQENGPDVGLKTMTQLSGGQKSLVALALIFAIQKCDPAPFYLFDEIDAALDAQYRTSVAKMVHELSTSAQFITTTFRPELLVNADKFYGVTFTNKVSRIQCITREDATQFVEQEQPQ
ncbi:UNVERIFIED_CONTAM: Structural maintenance of chromosomes protein 3, partial [Siphonaria sp. JEL0065]